MRTQVKEHICQPAVHLLDAVAGCICKRGVRPREWQLTLSGVMPWLASLSSVVARLTACEML